LDLDCEEAEEAVRARVLPEVEGVLDRPRTGGDLTTASDAAAREARMMMQLSSQLFPLLVDQLPVVLEVSEGAARVDKGRGQSGGGRDGRGGVAAARVSSIGAYLRLLLALVIRAPSALETGTRAGLLIRALAKAIIGQTQSLLARSRGGARHFNERASAGVDTGEKSQRGGNEQLLRICSFETDSALLCMRTLYYMLAWAISGSGSNRASGLSSSPGSGGGGGGVAPSRETKVSGTRGGSKDAGRDVGPTLCSGHLLPAKLEMVKRGRLGSEGRGRGGSGSGVMGGGRSAADRQLSQMCWVCPLPPELQCKYSKAFLSGNEASKGSSRSGSRGGKGLKGKKGHRETDKFGVGGRIKGSRLDKGRQATRSGGLHRVSVAPEETAAKKAVAASFQNYLNEIQSGYQSGDQKKDTKEKNGSTEVDGLSVNASSVESRGTCADDSQARAPVEVDGVGGAATGAAVSSSVAGDEAGVAAAR
ncbi:unnamed protein product, partial [Choristocarpus tenellus]